MAKTSIIRRFSGYGISGKVDLPGACRGLLAFQLRSILTIPALTFAYTTPIMVVFTSQKESRSVGSERGKERDGCGHHKERVSHFVKLCLGRSCFCLEEKVISRKPAMSNRLRSGVMGIIEGGDELTVE